MDEILYGAFDFGGTKTVLAIVRHNGTVVRRKRWETPARPSAADTVAAWVRAWREIAADLRPRQLWAVGVAAPGPATPGTGVLHQVFDWGWRDVPLGPLLQGAIGVPVLLDNDVNCCCLAERRFGAARDASDLLWVQVSTGVGGALFLRGEVYGGASGLAGEIGHVVLEEDGPECACGRRGCLQALCSGPAVARRWMKARGGGATGSATAEDVFAALRDGDETAGKVVAAVAEDLGRGLAVAVNLLDPAMVVLGGGVMLGLSAHLPAVEAAMRSRVIGAARRVAVVPSAVGYDAALLGAAALAGAGRCPLGRRPEVPQAAP